MIFQNRVVSAIQNLFDDIQPVVQGAPGPDRTIDPALQQPAAHIRGCAIHCREEGMLVAALDIGGQLEVATGSTVNMDCIVSPQPL